MSSKPKFNVTMTTGPDLTNPHDIDWTARRSRALVPFELSGGLPVNPLVSAAALAALPVGRGGLWHWGEAVAADSIVTATDRDGVRRLLLVERSDGHGWALPGGMLDAGESPATAASRELVEETGLYLHPEWFHMLPAQGVPDPRQGQAAWMVTVPGRLDLGQVDALPAVTGLDDAADAAWLPATSYPALLAELDGRGGVLFPAHRDLLAGLL